MANQTEGWSTWKKVGVWALQVLLAFAFIASGGAKVAGAESMVEMFDNIGMGQWFRYVTGFIEIGGGLLALWPKYAWVGAGLLACTMVGAILTHLLIIGGTIMPPLILLVLAVTVAWIRRW